MKTIKIMSLVLMGLALSGCGNSWEMTKKNWSSDLSDLPRRVTIWDSLTGETVWTFEGPVYLSDHSSPGNLSIIYRDSNGKLRKNDYVGQHLAISLEEVAK